MEQFVCRFFCFVVSDNLERVLRLNLSPVYIYMSCRNHVCVMYACVCMSDACLCMLVCSAHGSVTADLLAANIQGPISR
jgi:hypothetical protein